LVLCIPVARTTFTLCNCLELQEALTIAVLVVGPEEFAGLATKRIVRLIGDRGQAENPLIIWSDALQAASEVILAEGGPTPPFPALIFKVNIAKNQRGFCHALVPLHCAERSALKVAQRRRPSQIINLIRGPLGCWAM
jgi:hypothetical protein